MAPDFDAVSPINYVEKIQAPLLLVHGEKDVTVDFEQSQRMYDRMKKANKDVELVPLKLADHYFLREPDRAALLEAMEAFLAKHNPAD
jgi:dipeptidyl aminopeptidase/acylaminoacyl peptidase